MASENYSDSEESFNGFNSDDINDYHNNANELNDSDLDISSIGSSDNDDGQSDIDILSVESSHDNNDTASESCIESTGENGSDDGEQLVTYNPVWTTNLENFQVPYFTLYMGSLLPPHFTTKHHIRLITSGCFTHNTLQTYMLLIQIHTMHSVLKTNRY